MQSRYTNPPIRLIIPKAIHPEICKMVRSQLLDLPTYADTMTNMLINPYLDEQ